MNTRVTHAKIAIRIPRWLGYSHEIYRGIGNYITEHRLRWQIESDFTGDGELESFCIDEHWEGDGAILFRYTDAEAAMFLRSNTPLVCISRESQAPWVPRVHPDNHMLGRLAAEHLIETGADHLCCWCDPNRTYSVERRDGFLELAGERQHKVNVMGMEASLISSALKWELLNDSMLKQLEIQKLPAAVFARDDIAAAGLLRMALSLGIACPDEISILGVGDYPGLNAITTPSMSSVKLPARKMGWHAARIIHERLQMEDPCAEAEVVCLPVNEVVRRETTSFRHVGQPLVDEACQVVRKQLAKGKKVMVSDLCRAVGASSSTLLKSFRDTLGLSPKQFIAKAQYLEAARLLDQTSWSVKQISYELGFRTPEEFSRFFKRHAGLSPASYRQRA